MKILIPDFDAYQHYSDRRPPWIKLPRKLLDAFAFRGVEPVSRFVFIGLLLLANENAAEEGEGVVDTPSGELGFLLELTEMDAINAISELEDAGLLRLEDAGPG